MRKIFFVIDSLTSGGAERVATVLANELSQRGNTITIISKAHVPPFYKLDPAVELIYPKTHIAYFGNKLLKLFSRMKVYWEIYNKLKKECPDLVISFSTTTNGSIIPICKFLGIRVIACEHNNYKLGLKSLFIRFIKRRIYPLTDMLTVLTNRDLNQYYGSFMKNVLVMPNPLSIKPINKRRKLSDKNILVIGNVSKWEQKGFDNLLEIFSEVVKKYPGWKLKIAGGGSSDYLNDLIRKLDLETNVELLGAVKDIPSLMRKCAVFVLTSRYEGLPMALIEAMSQGMACVAFDCFTGPGDIITHGVDGILVENQNKVKFIESLSVLIEDESLRSRLGENAIETSKKYLPNVIMDRWVNLIDKVTTRSK